MKNLRFALLVAGLTACGGTANAGIVYDTTLASPNTIPGTSGWYDGTGNPQGGFTVDTENGVEIGLRAKHRQDAAVIDTPNNVYHVQAGPQGGGVTNRAWWNYEFSIDLRPNGVGTLSLTDIFPYSTITVQDLTLGFTSTVAFPYWIDDATWGPTGKSDLSTAAADWGLQNSENGVFADFPLNLAPGYPGFDMNAQDYYRFTVNIATAAGRVASESIDVAVGNAALPVPEPGTLPVMAFGLIAAGAFAGRRKLKAAFMGSAAA